MAALDDPVLTVLVDTPEVSCGIQAAVITSTNGMKKRCMVALEIFENMVSIFRSFEGARPMWFIDANRQEMRVEKAPRLSTGAFGY